MMKKVERLLREKNVIKNYIKHEDYKNVLLNNKRLHHKMKSIRSQKHQLGSYEVSKISLSCFNDKCYIHNNGITSYTYGHHKMTPTFPFIKYRYPYCGEDVTSFPFTQISISILWRRCD